MFPSPEGKFFGITKSEANTAVKPRRREGISPDSLPLFEFSNVVNSSLDLQFILSTVLLTTMGKMLVAKGMVLLRKEEHRFEVVAAKGIDQASFPKAFSIEKTPRAICKVDKLASSRLPWIDTFVIQNQKLLVPILSEGKVVGLMSLGERMSGTKYSAMDTHLIQSLVNLSGSAIAKALIIDQLKEANRSIDRKYQELNTLFDLSKEFNVGLDAEKVVRLLTFALLGQVGASKYIICLRNHSTLQIVAARPNVERTMDPLLEQLCEIRKAEFISDLARQKRFREPGVLLQQKGMTAVIPMQMQSQIKGLILVGERLRGGNYSKVDLEFISSLGNLAIISIENARLFKEAIEKQRMEDELKIAREIQQGLLPEDLPHIQGFEIAAINIPSKQVGGDYYDALARSEREFVIAIGDVSGKGTPAALLMANVQAALRTLVPIESSLPKATAQINDLTSSNTRGAKFITFFWGILDVGSRTLRYVNAGHNPPLLLRTDGSVERLEVGGLILGIIKTQTPYQEGSVRFQSGDTLVMYTDGVSEAMDSEGRDFTEERLEVALKRYANLPANEIIHRVQQELETHTKDTPQSDDITMVVIKAL
ncbi:MAG: SpoIIE family protein phosphatase [Ignavibacteriales bacterium]|nr:SpoIIE family protein phosphatase [Ignavibacteriales bacterium]